MFRKMFYLYNNNFIKKNTINSSSVNKIKEEFNKSYKKPSMRHILGRAFLYTSIFASSYYSYKYIYHRSFEEISINELKNKNDYESIKIVNEKSLLAKKINENNYYKVDIPNVEYFEKHINSNNVPVYFENKANMLTYLNFFYLGLVILALSAMVRNFGGVKNILEINKEITVKKVNKSFNDVIGQKNAVRAIKEFVDIIINREKYSKLGVVLPKGALLSGPPGTGKTLLAKAVAGECKLPFVNVSGSDFNAMFVGVGSSRIKNLYETAKEAADEHGGCIIFIDEIDAIGQKRNSNITFGGNSERENTLNQLLTEMDGFEENTNVVTLAATNRPELLDEALIRPGRFDRKVYVDIPTISDRIDLFNFYLSKLNLDHSIIKRISEFSSKLTPGFSGADIANIVNEAGIIAVRNKKDIIDDNDVKDAIDYVMMGDTKDNILIEKERSIVAYHEAGHGFLSYILENVENPVKISIVPREKGMLGFSQSEVSNENLTSKKKMEQQMIVLMGGRASEEIFCEDVTNGAANDIERASEIAKHYIKTFGFGKNKFVNVHDNNPYKNDISNYIKDDTDKETIELLNEFYFKALQILKDNRVTIENIKNELLKHNTIYYETIEELIKKRKKSIKVKL